jgi:radical SAM-linked protein
MSETLALQPLVPAVSLHRIRMTFARRAALRYISHLEMQLVWERTLRRAGVPLAYSKGFTPHPRLQFASALPLGFLSRCEIADIWLELPCEAPVPDPALLMTQVQASTPPGLEILHAACVTLTLPALQTLVRTAEYLALPLDPVAVEPLIQKVEELLQAKVLPRERRGKAYDLRPLIEILEICLDLEEGQRAGFNMRLTSREGATGRPEEVLDALGLDASAYRIERTALILAPVMLPDESPILQEIAAGEVLPQTVDQTDEAGKGETPDE